MYKRLNKNINRYVKKKKSEKNNNNNNNRTKPSKLTSSYFKCWLHWVYYNEADGRQRSLSTQSTKYMRGPLISAGEGGGLLPRSVLNTASRVSY